ncbi:MAG: hypothetical protein A2X94_15855 [Bdellovibrionales bacterium GWB1_55_8]|nr:MAG: hypothetical protein A2X94_15855 [Bdellovibrionales bacterium GWB1_55_8]
MAKTTKSIKFNMVTELHDRIVKIATTTRTGEVRIKRGDLKKTIEDVFTTGAKKAASGERVRFPVIGTLVRKDVQARKAGKGVNPFTGEAMTIKARPATKKPRWSFPKSLKETFANKRFW